MHVKCQKMYFRKGEVSILDKNEVPFDDCEQKYPYTPKHTANIT